MKFVKYKYKYIIPAANITSNTMALVKTSAKL